MGILKAKLGSPGAVSPIQQYGKAVGDYEGKRARTVQMRGILARVALKQWIAWYLGLHSPPVVSLPGTTSERHVDTREDIAQRWGTMVEAVLLELRLDRSAGKDWAVSVAYWKRR
jgi:hypothetical protein